MDIIEFLGLHEAEQWEEFWDKCKFLENYIDVDIKCQLYRLHDFYVELTSDKVLGLHNSLNAFTDGPRLEKYILGDLDYINTDLEIDMP